MLFYSFGFQDYSCWKNGEKASYPELSQNGWHENFEWVYWTVQKADEPITGQ